MSPFFLRTPQKSLLPPRKFEKGHTFPELNQFPTKLRQERYGVACNHILEHDSSLFILPLALFLPILHLTIAKIPWLLEFSDGVLFPPSILN